MDPSLSLLFIAFSIILIVVFTAYFKYSAFFTLLLVSIFLAVLTLPMKDVMNVITSGFGSTMKSIGLIIIFGITLGLILEKSGATHTLALAIIRVTGSKNAGFAIHLTGFITGIPIFCDSGFVVLNGINKSLSESSGKPLQYMAPVLAAGLYAVHCLIPPHPGATAAAGIMGANLGLLVLAGIPLSFVAAFSGFLWIRWLNRKNIPGVIAQNENQDKMDQGFPRVLPSLLPILLPLLLLSIRTLLPLFTNLKDFTAIKMLTFMGEPPVALLTGVLLAGFLLKKNLHNEVNSLLESALVKSGPILALTAAGGIFGAVIKATGAGDWAGTQLAGTGLGILIPFLLAAFLKSAQGSSTVAVITTASMVAPLLTSLHLSSDSGIMVATLAMGCGSMVVSHTNDSYFWVITKFSDLTVRDTLRSFTTTSLIMGCTSFLILWLVSHFVL